MERLRTANPAPDTRLLRDESEDLTALLSATWQRSTNMQTQQPQKVEPADEERTRGWPIALAAAAVILLVVGAISLLATSDGAEPADQVPVTTTTVAVTTTVAALVETVTTVAPAPVLPKMVQIEAFDYGFTGFEGEIVAGDALEFSNGSDTEFHNLVVIRLDDGDSSTVADIAEIAPEDIDAGQRDQTDGHTVQIVAVIGHLDAAPGEDAFNGRLRLQVAGRYIALDMIPQGADPLTVRSAIDTFAPPYLVPGGPLGYHHGMIVEFFVIEK
jgi:hypothetical protein